jgi:hypothetical protein
VKIVQLCWAQCIIKYLCWSCLMIAHFFSMAFRKGGNINLRIYVKLLRTSHLFITWSFLRLKVFHIYFLIHNKINNHFQLAMFFTQQILLVFWQKNWDFFPSVNFINFVSLLGFISSISWQQKIDKKLLPRITSEYMLPFVKIKHEQYGKWIIFILCVIYQSLNIYYWLN